MKYIIIVIGLLRKVQGQQKQVESLKKDNQAAASGTGAQQSQIDKLKEENGLLKKELCQKGSSYSWCE